MSTPRLLDLFCGAGGAAVGYARAGFEVHGVDRLAHDDYPYPLIVADALDVLRAPSFLATFDVVHASPPCPRYTEAYIPSEKRALHPDLIDATRRALKAWGGTYVIENVPGALGYLDNPTLICGWAMGLRHIRRHRLFESNALIMSPGCLCPRGDTVSVFGHSGEDRRAATGNTRGAVPKRDAAALMGVEWMSRRSDISDAIPPAYTEHVGEWLLDHLRAAS